MGIKDKALAFGKRFKLDSHHAIERFGVFFGIFAVMGLVVVAGSGAAAFKAGSDAVSHTALYNTEFTSSKTQLKGTVDGVYTNHTGNRALVMMHFPASAAISYNAADYQAFLLGTNDKLQTEKVSTSGIRGTLRRGPPGRGPALRPAGAQPHRPRERRADLRRAAAEQG
jgi:hypothetical protein